MNPKRSRTKTVSFFGVFLSAAAVVAYGAGPGDWFGADPYSKLAGAEVQSGSLRINVVERGNLKSANSQVLKSEMEGQSTIIYLIEEGTRVEPGTLLCQLDASEIEEKRVSQEISVQNARAEFEKATQNLEIQKSQNASDKAAAQRNLDFARTDEKKYVEGDYPQEIKNREQAIALAEEQVKRDADTVKWSRELADKGFVTRTELEADELTLKRSEIELDKAERDLELFKEYEDPRRRKELAADVEEAERELERVALQAKARLADYEANKLTSEAKLDLEVKKLEKYNEQIEKAEIFAPVGGMVVYAQERGSRWGNDDPIAEGTSIRERQDIITIPVTEGMIAEVSLHESVFEQVQEGQPCLLTFDALPGREYRGIVKFKAHLPDKNSWWANPNLRLYRTEVQVLDPGPEMRPGMTCNIEILVDEIQDCLYVPVQSVFLNRGDTVCFVSSSGSVEMRTIETGRNNHKWVEVKDGLEPGELVLLSQPEGFTLEPAITEEEPEEDANQGPPSMGGPPGGTGGGRSGSGGRGGGFGGGEGRPSAKSP